MFAIMDKITARIICISLLSVPRLAFPSSSRYPILYTRKPMFAIMDRINSRICASWFLASSLNILSRVINAVGNYALCVLTTQRPLNDHSTTTQRPLSDHSTTTQTTTQNPLPPLFIKQWTRLDFMPFLELPFSNYQTYELNLCGLTKVGGLTRDQLDWPALGP